MSSVARCWVCNRPRQPDDGGAKFSPCEGCRLWVLARVEAAHAADRAVGGDLRPAGTAERVETYRRRHLAGLPLFAEG
jgi:hypothetical protein